MKRILAGLVAALGILLGLASPSFAQYSPYSRLGSTGSAGGYSPYSRPTLSPYLNLTRGGSAAANYYLGVVPEFQRRAQANQFSSQIRDLERRTTPGALEEDLLPTLPETGHGTQFLSYGSYYNYGSLGGYFGSSQGANPANARTPTRGRR